MKKTPENDLGADAAAVESAGSIAPEAATARHTPGPWTVETQWASDVDDNQFPFAHWIAGPEGEQIAEQILDKPDAHLIAAAPELYEALKLIVDFVDGDSSPVIEICGRHYDAARAAIRKAEGK
jgi:hypothetical protein